MLLSVATQTRMDYSKQLDCNPKRITWSQGVHIQTSGVHTHLHTDPGEIKGFQREYFTMRSSE